MESTAMLESSVDAETGNAPVEAEAMVAAADVVADEAEPTAIEANADASVVSTGGEGPASVVLADGEEPAGGKEAKSGEQPADGEQPAESKEAAGGEEPAGGLAAGQESNVAEKTEGVEKAEEAAAQPASDDGTQPTFASGSLSNMIKTEDGHTYTVRVAYTADAQIPEGSTLQVRELRDDLAAQTKKILSLGENDRMLDARYLQVLIEHEGNAVKPASDVSVTIETDTIEATRSACVEVALGVARGAEPEGTTDGVRVVPNNLTSDEGITTTLSFPTRTLGTMALAQVVTRQEVWGGKSMAVSLLVPRQAMKVSTANAAAPQLEQGVDPLACYAITTDPAPAYGTTLWVEARSTGEAGRDEADQGGAEQQEDALGGVIAYGVRDGELSEVLFEGAGCGQPVPVSASDEQLLLVWDSGYRSEKLEMRDVTVEGMMPENTEGTAQNVTQSYEKPQTLMDGIDDATAGEVAAGACELEALAAYDITLKADGGEYQPDEQHPLTVTIANDAVERALAIGKSVRVWHITDAGAVEAIEDFICENGTVSFEAPGFSTYVIAAVEASEDGSSSEPITLSTNFKIKASVGSYYRMGAVTFVDTEGNPLQGTVSGTLNIRFTGTGPESNETNTIDLHSFKDKLNPAIADEYEFSRVYTTLSESNQKNYRYMQVADGTAISSTGSPSVYRAYFYMNSIEENAAGRDYYGTWYNLTTSGIIDSTFIEFYHVAPASFNAIDTRNDPVEGAEFALYTDPDCYVPFEYKNEEVKATSNRQGVVSFGKIPQGTYYMKETVIPEGYKMSTNIYTVVVDGETAIADVMHEDDDGSVIIADVLRMTLTKEWDDNKSHANDSVTVDVYARGEVVEEVTLSASNDWTQTLTGLDPNEAYMVSETKVTSNGVDVTKSWIPHIDYEELDPHSEYYKADEFKEGKQYVMITTTLNGTRAMSSSGGLVTKPLEVSADGSQITGTVEDHMLWNVDTLTKDGVIALKNEATGAYLDMGSRWYLNPSYPVPLYVRHLNNDGKIRFYHRPNLNTTNSYYVYIWYGPNKEGQVDRYMNSVSQAGVFDIYRKVNVRSVDVTISNRGTRYPIQMKNVSYPKAEALPNMTYDLYTEEEYSETEPGMPLVSSLTAGTDGYLRAEGDGTQLELGAGTYYLKQTSNLEEEGYAPLKKAVKFTITRGGALRVAQDDQELQGFAYSTTEQVGDATLPLLQIPHMKSATVEVTLQVEGAYADQTREHEFTLPIPEYMDKIMGSIDGEEQTFTAENNSFKLRHGQTLRLNDVPAREVYELIQSEDTPYRVSARAETNTVDVAVEASHPHTVTISNLSGSAADPSRVTITNTLAEADVPATGLDDNVRAWGVIVAVSLAGLVVVFLKRRLAA